MSTESKRRLQAVKISVLDLVPVSRGNTQRQSFHNTLDLARNVEKWGYERYWISEHHNMESIVSSATPILLGYVAEGTSTIRVGSGGVMLPNHAPLIVAEQFGTLATLYPNRIDLGLGRAPGTDQLTAQALRRGRQENVQDFPNDLDELQQFLAKENEDERVRAIPGEGLDIPIYLLGSSTFSARLAGEKGLPYAFASHFAPAHLFNTLDIYRDSFRPSKQVKEPYAMACINLIAAETDAEAEYLATRLYQFAMGIITNVRNPLPPPLKSMEGIWNDAQQAMIKNMLHYTFTGSREKLEKDLSLFIERTGVKELIVVSHLYDHGARLESYRILSEVFGKISESV